MVVEEIETLNGWPLGLGNINMRLRASQNTQPPRAVAAEPFTIEVPSPSFSSFSSSNLDTESTASFFQDQSVSLGRLMGIKPGGNRGGLHFPNTISRSLSPRITQSREISKIHGADEEETSQQGLCVPLLHNVIEKMSKSKSSSRH